MSLSISSTPPIPGTSCRIAIVGEAPGEQEENEGRPFVGVSGQELTRMLAEAGIVREKCYLANAFSFRPPNNIIEQWCVKKAKADEIWKQIGGTGGYPLSPFRAGKYMDPRRLGDIQRLHKELVAFNPTITIALGNTPLWALTNSAGISASRGTLQMVDLAGGNRSYKILPTYHPAYILRQWDERAIVIADLIKANKESGSETYTRPQREIWIEPTLDNIRDFIATVLEKADEFSVDIETGWGQITCIGFGTRTAAISIPFLDTRKFGRSYWERLDEEREAWALVRHILNSGTKKIFQNGMYDIQWLWKTIGLVPKGLTEDTMLLHHSIFPEMSKGLGFLGSIYTNEASWKKMKPKKRTKQKKGDSEE